MAGGRGQGVGRTRQRSEAGASDAVRMFEVGGYEFMDVADLPFPTVMVRPVEVVIEHVRPSAERVRQVAIDECHDVC